MPEMVFGESSLSLLHISSGIKLHFNALDALRGWKQESLPPVEVPAAAKWKFRSKPSEQVILDYDYTFTTPYCGSEMIEPNYEKKGLHWQDTDERIDLAALSSREPILFYDEVVLYEDELADNGVSLLTVKVRVMPSCWFLLLRYWLRVDGVLMRLRDTRVYCAFGSNGNAEPVVLRESCWREATIQSLSAQGIPSDSAAYGDPNLIVHKLPIIMQKNQRLEISR
ncbi:TIP41-like protein isoform X1 [Ananas comosus]|uniref:TIP41-like protein isoform X1 n=1 Tax=Ananas comosus TaxID=4615 RepID=A0A6P5FPJ0_ANACO|nr:TIP41-like protein isoform X1 [Ananas comosus]XP_020095393.1 TIP41-like protein isoform X1 [Ananas comosus]